MTRRTNKTKYFTKTFKSVLRDLAKKNHNQSVGMSLNTKKKCRYQSIKKALPELDRSNLQKHML